MPLDTSSLANAIAQLEGALDYVASEVAQRDPQLKKHLRAAAIQAFEFTYELSFKMIRRYLAMTEASTELPQDITFQEIIRRAYEAGLLHSELSVWKGFRAHRGATSHSYQEAKAQEVFHAIPAFLAEATFLLNQLNTIR